MCSRNKEQSFYQNMNYTESEGMPFIHHNQNKCFKSYVRNDELFNFGRCFIHLIFKYIFIWLTINVYQNTLQFFNRQFEAIEKFWYLWFSWGSKNNNSVKSHRHSQGQSSQGWENPKVNNYNCSLCLKYLSWTYCSQSGLDSGDKFRISEAEKVKIFLKRNSILKDNVQMNSILTRLLMVIFLLCTFTIIKSVF